MNKIAKAVNEMEQIVVQFLDKHGDSYKNKHGVIFELDYTGERPRVITRFMLYQNNKPGLNKSISLFMGTISCGIFDFSLAYDIENVKSFNMIKPEHLVELYMESRYYGFVRYHHCEPKKNSTDIVLNFKIADDTTCVSSSTLNFYDEIPGKMHTLSQFQKYIKSHKQLLDWLVQNNAKLKSQFPKNFKLK